MVADGGDVEDVIAGGDAGDAEAARGIGGGAVGAADQLDHDIGERFAAAGVHHRSRALRRRAGPAIWRLPATGERGFSLRKMIAIGGPEAPLACYRWSRQKSTRGRYWQRPFGVDLGKEVP